MDQSLDLAVNGATVIDGSASKPFKADVGIKDDTIAVVGDLSDVHATMRLNADGLVVAPGFIDAHGHSDYTLLVDGRAVSQISQGVTTEVIGNCGHGCEPLTDDVDRFTGNIYGFDASVDLTWRTTEDFLNRLETANPAINVVPLTPAGNLRRVVIKDPDGLDRPAGASERRRMMQLIEDATVAGSNGISFGLEYRQEASASFDELVEQARTAGEHGGIVAIHTRDKDRQALEAVQEAISIAQASGAPVQVSHILPRRSAPAGSLDRIVDALATAKAKGFDIAFDVHTRTHGITSLSDCIAPGILKGGQEIIKKSLADRSWAEDVQEDDSIIHRFASSSWEGVQVFSATHSPEFVGMNVADIAKQENCKPWEAVRRILAATDGNVHGVMVVCDSYEEQDILDTARIPGCLVGSDATALCLDGPLGDARFLGAYSWAAWTYSKLTTNSPRLTPTQAVRKLATEPAERFGLADRGKVAVGKKADLAIFDPAKFATEASITNPNVLATGMRHVIVNGTVVLHNGVMTGTRSGQVIKRRR